jgi:hypothetical protein
MDSFKVPRPSVSVFASVIIIWIMYLFSLAVYRVYLSPLSKFPGPKLATATRWYEFYYDVVLKGQFSFKIQEMHKKYGIVTFIV